MLVYINILIELHNDTGDQIWMKTKIIIISLIIFLLSLSVASAADNTTLVKDQTPIKAIENPIVLTKHTKT